MDAKNQLRIPHRILPKVEKTTTTTTISSNMTFILTYDKMLYNNNNKILLASSIGMCFSLARKESLFKSDYFSGDLVEKGIIAIPKFNFYTGLFLHFPDILEGSDFRYVTSLRILKFLLSICPWTRDIYTTRDIDMKFQDGNTSGSEIVSIATKCITLHENEAGLYKK